MNNIGEKNLWAVKDLRPQGEDLEILAIPGSLRTDSLNRKLIGAAQELAPEGVRVELTDLRSIPLYDGDVEAIGDPESVSVLKERVRRAGAILIATPEYNASIPGVLKNALDWLSRPPQLVFRNKPVAIMGASPGNYGTVRAQGDLRRVLAHLDADVVRKPEVMVFLANEAFDEGGKLRDESVRELVASLLEKLASEASTAPQFAGHAQRAA